MIVAACGGKEAALAELTKADGPVDKQKESEDWVSAEVGTKFFLGDAARTGKAGGAQLAVAGGAQITMQPSTVLRFGGKGNQNRILVEVGAIDLTGTGSYGLQVGEVSLRKNGTVRITAEGNGKQSIRLTLGEAMVTTAEGTQELKLDELLELGLVKVTPVPVADAGVADAPAEPPDAPAIVDIGEASIDVVGKRGEILRPNETKWAQLPVGKSDVPKGAKLKLGAGTTAKLVARGTTLALTGGSRASVGDDFSFTLEAGGASVAMTDAGSISMPGGAMAMTGTATSPSEARLDGGGAGTKITVQRNTAKLTGLSGNEKIEHNLNRGESATLLKNGTIRPLEAIPTYFDFRVGVGETITIHDPRPPTAVQFQFGGKCPEGGIIEVDRDPRFRTAKISAGKETANHLIRGGGWSYRLRCTKGGGEGPQVAAGRIAVLADSGTKTLPGKPGVNPFELDGRPWAYSYQSAIPDLAVKFPGTGSSFRLHLARGGKDTVFESKSNRLLVKGSSLSEGVYTYWFERDGVRQDKINTLKIDFDQTAPQVYIELPINGKPWSGDIDVKGAVLPGWTAAVDGVNISIDKARRFIVKAGIPTGNALAIRLAHPQRGVHYYLRRAK